MDERVIDAAPIGLGAFDRDCRWVRANATIAQQNGFAVDALLGRRPSELHGSRGDEAEERLRRVIETGEPERWRPSGELGTDPGHERTWDVIFYPLDEGVGVVAIDTTLHVEVEAELAEAHRRDAVMARAAQLLSTALSVQETADLVARLVVPEIADWCFVELVREDGSIDRVSFAHRDPAKQRWMHQLSERYPLDPESPVGSPKVIRTGEPEVIPDIPDEFLAQAAQDAEHLEVLRELGFRSAAIVPLIARGRTLGDIAIVQGAESGRRFGPEILSLATALADRCAVALDNAIAYHQRDVVALSLQEELLPRDLPPIPGLDVSARYAAAGQGNEVGGDFYDVFASEQGWLVVIGDVVGKGPAAAAVTGLARHTIRAAAAYERSPAALLDGLNRALLAEEPGRRMASVACVRLDAEDGRIRLTLSAAGHPLPLAVGADASVREIGTHGRLLGVDATPRLADDEDVLRPGELLVLYTDGVIDARGPGGVFGEDRLRALLSECAADAPSRVVQRIESAVLAASGGRLRDDLALIALRLRPRT